MGCCIAPLISLYVQLHYLTPLVVRLFGGSTRYEGRVEVYYNGEWGTVCDDDWDLNDAKVVCRQLGFGTVITARDNIFYGKGIGPVWLNNLNCTGTEVTIEDCSSSGFGILDCNHTEDASVECTNGNFTFTCVYFDPA